MWRRLVVALDMVDSKGEPDHGKIMGFVFFCVVVTLKVLGISFTLGELIVLASCIFGARVFIALLKSRTVTSTESIILSEIRRPSPYDEATR